MKKMLDRWRTHAFYYVKSSLRNWILNAKIDEKKALVKKEEQRLNDTEIVYMN